MSKARVRPHRPSLWRRLRNRFTRQRAPFGTIPTGVQSGDHLVVSVITAKGVEVSVPDGWVPIAENAWHIGTAQEDKETPPR